MKIEYDIEKIIKKWIDENGNDIKNTINGVLIECYSDKFNKTYAILEYN